MSGIEAITHKEKNQSDMPTGWKEIPLGEIGVFQYGYTTSASQTNTGVKFLRITDIKDDGNVNWTTVPYCEISSADLEKYRLREGNLLLARIGATTGKTCLVKAEVPNAVFASYLIRFIPKDSVVSPAFLFYFTQSQKYWESVNAGKEGKLKKGLNTTELGKFPVTLPPFPEQKIIAAVLSVVQEARDKIENVVRTAKELKKSLMKYLFTYGIVPVEEAENVRLQETDFGAVPSHWRIMPLDRCSIVQTGVAKGRRLAGADVISVPYLRVANVQDGYLNLTEMKHIEIRRSELNRFLLQKGDIVLTEGGDFDKLGRGFIWQGEIPSCVHQNHIFAVRAEANIITPDFLGYMVQSSYAKAYFLSVAHKTTNLACINTTKLKALPVPVPPRTEQERIASMLGLIDHRIRMEENKKKTIEELFKTLLLNLMTGKVRVNELEV